MGNRESKRRSSLGAAVLALVLVGGLLYALTRRGFEKPAASESTQAPALIVQQQRAGEGRWRKVAEAAPAELTDEQRQRMEQLRSIGYAAGSVEVDRSGVTVHLESETWGGWNFYSAGHAPEAVLMDMDGRELHRWQLDFREVWPDSQGWKKADANWWRRVYLYDNGDVLAIFEGHGLVKLDRDSNLLWARFNRAHHDLEVMPGGDIYVLTREPRMLPWVHETEPTLEDFLTLLDRDGNEKAELSIFEAFRRSPYRDLVFRSTEESGDVMHTNTLHVLDGRSADRMPALRRGNVLMAMNHLGVVAVLDPEREEIVWAFQGPPHGHHDPSLLENGNLLLFENQKKTQRSVVVELDPVDFTRVWEYRGTPQQPFFSKTCGAARRLPNGNTLITESDGGRAFEVDAGGRIVWEFYTPHRAGENGEYIATLAEMVRLPPDFPTDWLPRGAGPRS